MIMMGIYYRRILSILTLFLLSRLGDEIQRPMRSLLL
jgi:hypothetical protein